MCSLRFEKKRGCFKVSSSVAAVKALARAQTWWGDTDVNANRSFENIPMLQHDGINTYCQSIAFSARFYLIHF
jgi:hypothetical protein